MGYLREAYHGGPYVTRFLVKEAFEADNAEAKISAKLLRQRLPIAVLLSLYREHVVYGEEALKPLGIIELDEGVDAWHKAFTDLFGANGQIEKMKKGDEEAELAARVTPSQIAAVETLIKKRSLPMTALAFVDFVNLLEKKEAETGQACTVIASY